MDIVYALVFGLVQGLTEFLPVSSSGHLVLLHQWTGFSLADDVAFDVALHVATMIAVIGYFRLELAAIVRAWARHAVGRGPLVSDARLGWLLIAGTVPAAGAGAVAEDWLTATFRTIPSVAVALAVVAGLMLFTERFTRPRRNLPDLRLPDALVVGCAQAVALIPGVSRSGITIIAGLQRGLHRETAARFSFLLSVPIMFGAGAKKLAAAGAFPPDAIVPLAAGFTTALASGWWAIGFLLRYLKRAPLNVFAYYRIALAAVLLLLPYLATHE